MEKDLGGGSTDQVFSFGHTKLQMSTRPQVKLGIHRQAHECEAQKEEKAVRPYEIGVQKTENMIKNGDLTITNIKMFGLKASNQEFGPKAEEWVFLKAKRRKYVK